jgi:hypothetical protein
VDCVDIERMLFCLADVAIVRLLCELDLGLDWAVECVDTERMLFCLVGLLCDLDLDLVGDETSSSLADSPECLLPKRMACMVDGPSLL